MSDNRRADKKAEVCLQASLFSRPFTFSTSRHRRKTAMAALASLWFWRRLRLSLAKTSCHDVLWHKDKSKVSFVQLAFEDQWLEMTFSWLLRLLTRDSRSKRPRFHTIGLTKRAPYKTPSSFQLVVRPMGEKRRRTKTPGTTHFERARSISTISYRCVKDA